MEMNNTLKETISIIEQYENTPDFLDALFDKDKEDALKGRPSSFAAPAAWAKGC